VATERPRSSGDRGLHWPIGTFSLAYLKRSSGRANPAPETPGTSLRRLVFPGPGFFLCPRRSTGSQPSAIMIRCGSFGVVNAKVR
jgi:hypothetical protein